MIPYSEKNLVNLVKEYLNNK
mgnify:CR=1